MNEESPDNPHLEINELRKRLAALENSDFAPTDPVEIAFENRLVELQSDSSLSNDTIDLTSIGNSDLSPEYTLASLGPKTQRVTLTPPFGTAVIYSHPDYVIKPKTNFDKLKPKEKLAEEQIGRLKLDLFTSERDPGNTVFRLGKSYIYFFQKIDKHPAAYVTATIEYEIRNAYMHIWMLREALASTSGSASQTHSFTARVFGAGLNMFGTQVIQHQDLKLKRVTTGFGYSNNPSQKGPIRTTKTKKSITVATDKTVVAKDSGVHISCGIDSSMFVGSDDVEFKCSSACEVYVSKIHVDFHEK